MRGSDIAICSGPERRTFERPSSSNPVDSVVLAMGGSVVAPGQADPAFIAQLAEALDRMSLERPLLCVVGGGKTARDAIGLARDAGGSEDMLDRIGIAATRLNAQTLIGFLAARGVSVNDDVPLTTGDATELSGAHRIVVMGGTTPGHSTDYVGAELAKASQAARLVIATNVDGVYDKDPSKHRDAERIDCLSFDRLMGIVGSTEWQSAGQAGVVDGPATALLRDMMLETRVVHGADLDNLKLAVSGEDFEGTLITEA
jgi:uridylate kinase